jgi:hypothetical protein
MVLGDKLKRKYWEERGMLGIMAKLAKNHLQGSFNKRKEEDEKAVEDLGRRSMLKGVVSSISC